MRSRRLAILIGAVIALAAIGALAGVVLYEWQRPRLRERIVAILSERLDSDVELGELDVSIGRTVVVTAHGLVLRQRRHPDAPPLVAVNRFTVTAPLMALTRTPIHVESVDVVGLHIVVPPRRAAGETPRDAAGGSQASGFSGAIGGPTPVVVDRLTAEDAVLQVGVRKADRPPRTFLIHRLDLRNAAFDRPTHFEAELTNPTPAGRIAATGTFGPWQPYEPTLTELEGDYTFRHADLSTIDGIAGTLESTGAFSGRLERISVKGETRTPDFSLDIGGEPLPLTTAFTAIVDGTSGDTLLDQVSATLGRTPLIARGGVVHMQGAADRTVELDVAIDNGRLEDILRLAVKAEPPAMAGALHLRTHLELPPGKARVAMRLKLNGDFRVAQARFSSSTVQSKIDELSRRGRGAPGDATVSNVASELQGAFVLGGGTLSLSRVSFAVRGATVQMAGRYALAPGTVDFTGTARLQAHVSEMVTGWKRTPLRILDPLFARGGAGTVVPIRVTGPATKPDFRVEFKKIFR